MERYGTDHEVEDSSAMVYTKPKKTTRVYRYLFHLRGGYWVLSRERDWYTEHALKYAGRKFDREVLQRHVPPSQTPLGDFTGGGVQGSPSVIRCEGD
jgi:hypothetical protein